MTDLSDVDLAALEAEAFVVIERIALVEVAVVLHRLRIPADLTLDQARARVRAQPTGVTGDFNHFYRTEEAVTASGAAPARWRGWHSRGALMLAAAGNGGPRAEVAYPAGYPDLVAVTAVDQRGQVYRRAQRGPQLDLAAPGVEVWSATLIRGLRPETGTSFAVPFATAAAAILAARDPAATPSELAAGLGGPGRGVRRRPPVARAALPCQRFFRSDGVPA